MTQFTLVNNASTTLAAAAASGATSLTLASATNFPSSIPAGVVLPLTLNDAATRNIYEVVYVTAISGTTLTVVRGQEGTTAQNWGIGDFAFVAMTAGVFTSALPARSALTANTNFFVNASTGSDANNGLTSGTAWATLQHAWSTLQSKYDLAGFIATVSVADGTYTTGLIAAGIISGQAGAAGVVFLGDNTTPSNCVISTTSADCIKAIDNAQITVSGFQFKTTTSGNGLYGAGGTILFNHCDFNTCANNHIRSDSDSRVIANGPYTVSANTAVFADTNNGFIGLDTQTCTLTGTPNFSTAFANANEAGFISAIGVTFTGSATGVRYSAQLNGVIFTNGGGANYFPGNSPGTTASGGQYA